MRREQCICTSEDCLAPSVGLLVRDRHRLFILLLADDVDETLETHVAVSQGGLRQCWGGDAGVAQYSLHRRQSRSSRCLRHIAGHDTEKM